MARLPDALEHALDVARHSPDASVEEALHELGISTKEALTLVTELNRQADDRGEAIALSLYLGILIGRGLERQLPEPELVGGQPSGQQQRRDGGRGAQHLGPGPVLLARLRQVGRRGIEPRTLSLRGSCSA